MNQLTKRKHPRLKDYDYSQNGYYHITICVKDNMPLLSSVIVGRGLAPATVEMTEIGKVVEAQLLDLQDRYPNIVLDKYVIMPTHIHLLLIIRDSAGASPRPTISDAVCVFKSLTIGCCKKQELIKEKTIWQTSFYDEVIKNDEAYREIWRYIDENPTKWAEDRYNSETIL
jgi:REP element-mobilizing transposase RayT